MIWSTHNNLVGCKSSFYKLIYRKISLTIIPHQVEKLKGTSNSSHSAKWFSFLTTENNCWRDCCSKVTMRKINLNSLRIQSIDRPLFHTIIDHNFSLVLTPVTMMIFLMSYEEDTSLNLNISPGIIPGGCWRLILACNLDNWIDGVWPKLQRNRIWGFGKQSWRM